MHRKHSKNTDAPHVKGATGFYFLERSHDRVTLHNQKSHKRVEMPSDAFEKFLLHDGNWLLQQGVIFPDQTGMLQVARAYGDSYGHIRSLRTLGTLLNSRYTVSINDEKKGEKPIHRVIRGDELRVFSEGTESKYFTMPLIEYFNIVLKSLKVFCSSRQIEFSGNSFVLQAVKAEAA